jgi:hypothetical protein
MDEEDVFVIVQLAQRFVLDPVSRGRDDAQLDVALFEAMGGDRRIRT